MSYCIYCGEKLQNECVFCSKCGKRIDLPVPTVSHIQDEIGKYQTEASCTKQIFEEANDDSIKRAHNLVLIQIIVGVGILLFMYMLGATSTYPNVYVTMSLEYNKTVIFWYGILYGFAIRAIQTIGQNKGRISFKDGVGGAIIGLLVSIPSYILLSAAQQIGGYIVFIVFIFVVSTVIPVSKSVKLIVGSRVELNGVQGLKKNLLIGFISGIVGAVFMNMMNGNLYIEFGLVGFICYMALQSFNSKDMFCIFR